MKSLKAKTFCHIAFLLALVFKMFSLGVDYFPVLDDYIQYGGYPLYDNLSHVYLNIGTIATRPFASLLDPLVWGKFFPNLYVVAGIIAVLFFLGAYLMGRSFERMGIYITPYLYAILLLFPLGFEGTYWISASSRICVGIFFTGLALELLIKCIEKKRRLLYVLYILVTFLSFGFYESVMITSAILQFFAIIFLVKSNKRRAKFLLTPVLCGIIMVIYYKLAGNIGALSSRANGFEFSGIENKLSQFFAQLYDILITGSLKTTVHGAISGFKFLISSYFGFLILVVSIVISALCGYFGGKLKFCAPAKYCIPMGLALVFLPLVPNVFVSQVWLTYRSIVVCFIGLVLVSAPLFSKILDKRTISTAIIFIMVFVFSLANVNELNTYKRVYVQDDLLVTEIANELEQSVLDGNKNAIVVLPEEISVPQISYYKDHVKSVFGSDWALTGAVRAKCRNVKIKMLTPVYSLDGINTKDKQIIYLGGNNE